jgi:hypothetical protein
MLVHQLGAGFLLVTCRLWLQSAGIAVLVAWIRHATEGDIQKMDPSARICAGREIHDSGGHAARIGDSAVDELLSVDLFTDMRLSNLLLGMLFDSWLWRRSPTVTLAILWAAGEHDRGVDVRNIREPSLCDSHLAHQPR